MKQTLLFTLSSFAIATFMTACTGQMADTMAVVGKPALSSDPCAAIDKKVMRLDRFTEVVQNTSAFHLEEKAAALPVPGITVSNNRKQMLRDAKKKRAELSKERQTYGCKTPMPVSTAQMPDKKAVVSKPALSSDPSADIDKKMIKPDEFTTKVNTTSVVHVEEKAAALPVPGITVNNNKEEMVSDAEKKDAELEVERQKYADETPMPVSTAQMPDKKAVVSKPALSSDLCDTIDKKLIKLYEFTIMVNNTSAFHLEEKAAALSVPGITVSNNKKKMLKDAEKKRAELSKERQKYGCETSKK
ncbi:MAG: hypothetical protein OQK45_03575 [Sulfurovum sp.]|nr:hypothetical protein [Sulfurovum sp.]